VYGFKTYETRGHAILSMGSPTTLHPRRLAARRLLDGIIGSRPLLPKSEVNSCPHNLDFSRTFGRDGLTHGLGSAARCLWCGLGGATALFSGRDPLPSQRAGLDRRYDEIPCASAGPGRRHRLGGPRPGPSDARGKQNVGTRAIPVRWVNDSETTPRSTYPVRALRLVRNPDYPPERVDGYFRKAGGGAGAVPFPLPTPAPLVCPPAHLGQPRPFWYAVRHCLKVRTDRKTSSQKYDSAGHPGNPGQCEVNRAWGKIPRVVSPLYHPHDRELSRHGGLLGRC
jgi:hypothetical protein